MPSSVATVSSVRTLVVPTHAPAPRTGGVDGVRLLLRHLVVFAVHVVVGDVVLLDRTERS